MILMFLVVISFCMGFSCAVLVYKNKRKIEIKNKEEQHNKLFLYFHILNMWMEMRQKGKSAVSFLQKKQIRKIAIYGMKELGERFYEEVKNTDIEVVCIIDKNPQQVLGDFRVISPKENIPKVDAVIVTADYYFAEIKKQMEERVDCPIYSLHGVLGNSFGRNF